MSKSTLKFPDIEKVSAIAHARWIDARREAGATSEKLDDTGEELMVPYDVLSHGAKELVRVEVRAVFLAVGEHGLPIGDEVDELASAAHARWIEQRKIMGATTEVLDDTKEELMVPFATLSAKAQALVLAEVVAVVEAIRQENNAASASV